MMEAVIALAVVVLVTASALSIANSSTTSRVKAIDKNKAINCAHNIIECFKVSDDQSTFEQNVVFADNIYLEDKWTTSIDSNGNSYITVPVKINDFSINVTIENGFNARGSKITVTVTEGEGGKPVVDLSYTKSGYSQSSIINSSQSGTTEGGEQ